MIFNKLFFLTFILSIFFLSFISAETLLGSADSQVNVYSANSPSVNQEKFLDNDLNASRTLIFILIIIFGAAYWFVRWKSKVRSSSSIKPAVKDKFKNKRKLK